MEVSRKGVAEMLGDALREIAVLLIVFAPLDRCVEKRPYGWRDFWQTFGTGSYFVRKRIERTRRT